MTNGTAAGADILVRDEPDRQRYALVLDGETAGFIEYRLSGDLIVFRHTVIGDEYEGRGLGSRLATLPHDDVPPPRLRVVPRCPFIAAYIESHPLYADLVVNDDASSGA